MPQVRLSTPFSAPGFSRSRNKTSLQSIRARYEGELVARFAERYPDPTPEQKTKIEARIGVLVERALANIEAPGGSGLAKNTLVERYERGLMQRASQKLGRDLTPGLERVLSKRIQEAGRRYWDRLINLDERTPAGVEQVVGSETARERTEELRKREAERYETPLRERLKQRYPNPSPEQKRKIEARVQTLMGLTTLTSRNDGILIA